MRFFTLARHSALALLAFAASAAHAANYSDIWWNPGESGWGLTIADHETNLWAVWYTYRSDGSPTWMFVSGGTFDATRTRFSGALYQATGPSYAAAFTSRPVNVAPVGSVSLDFAPAGLPSGVALFSYTVGGVTGTRQVQRYAFGTAPATWGRDATDLWWDPAESGSGIALSQHGGMLFAVWYTYDEAGQPLFVFLPSGNASGDGRFSGDAFTTRGPWFGAATYDASQVRVQPLGSVQLSLTPLPAVEGFVPQRGDWSVRLGDGSTLHKFITQLGFGHAAPGVSAPPCLAAGSCVQREAPATAGRCSYRRCTAAVMGTDYYGYRTTVPCTCSSDALDMACTASRPPAADGGACGTSAGCGAGSVCADLQNGMPAVCMAESMFNASYCGY